MATTNRGAARPAVGWWLDVVITLRPLLPCCSRVCPRAPWPPCCWFDVWQIVWKHICTNTKGTVLILCFFCPLLLLAAKLQDFIQPGPRLCCYSALGLKGEKGYACLNFSNYGTPRNSEGLSLLSPFHPRNIIQSWPLFLILYLCRRGVVSVLRSFLY